MRRFVLYFLSILMMMLPAFSVHAKEYNWSKWRGPDENGISKETNWNPEAIKNNPDIKWSVEVGKGYSNVAIFGNHLYTIGHADQKDTVFCLDFNTGDVIWKFSYPATRGQYAGPRATPVLSDGKLYTISRDGRTYCLNAETGNKIWGKDIAAEFGVYNITWGISGSPLIYKNLIIINADKSGLALDKNTGKMVWSGGRGNCGYATPVIFTKNSRNYAAIFSQTGLFIVNPATGRKHAFYEWRTMYDENAADPVVTDEGIFLSSNTGCALLRFTGKKLNRIWENRNLATNFSTSIVMDGYIYGIHGSPYFRRTRLICISLKTGERKWESNIGYEAVTAAGDNLINITNTGDLIIVTATPHQYKVIAETKVINDRRSDFWTAPIICRGYIFVRSGNGTLVCVNVNN